MQEYETGFAPRPIQLFRQGYKGSDPEHHDTMCSHVAKDQLVSCSFELLVNYSNSKL
jgi:hypothetical protein